MVLAAPDATSGPLAPNRSSSEPFGAHVFLMRKNNLGKNDALQLKAYYPADTNWNNQYIYIDPLDVCEIDFVSDTNDGNNSPITYLTVTLSTLSGSVSYPIKIDKESGMDHVCNYASNNDGVSSVINEKDGDRSNYRLFARYALPPKPSPDSETDLLAVTMTIAYDNVNQPVKSDEHNNQQRFQVRATQGDNNLNNNGDVFLGPTGGDDNGEVNSKYNFPIIGRPQHYDTMTQVSLPFGLPCSVKTPQPKKVGLYDADNFPGPPVKFRVKDMGSADTKPTDNVEFYDGENEKEGTQRKGNFSTDWFTPNPINKGKSSVMITMEPGHKYQIQVINIDGGNTVVVNVPTETIFGVIDCPEKWRMKGESSVSSGYAAPGDTVTFTHTFRNVGKNDSDNVTGSIKWGKAGKIMSGNVAVGGAVASISKANPLPANSYKADEGEVETVAATIKIPANAANNDLYCQYTNVDKWKESLKVPHDFDYVCVTVRLAQPPPDETVVITPYVTGTPDEVEPTEPAFFTGYVTVSHFPALSEYGYREYSEQADASRISPTRSGGLESERGPDGVLQSTTNTTYSCTHPNDYDKKGSTCYHEYLALDTKTKCTDAGHQWNGSLGSGCRDTHPATPASTTTYSCNAPYKMLGSNSSAICYEIHYRCQGETTWGPKNENPQPSCPYTYTCPTGVTKDTSTDPPKCNAWKCPYAGAPVVPGTQPPTCEYRCTGFFGPGSGDRAYSSDGSASTPCYQVPQFTVKCTWDNGTVTSSPITGNGSTGCRGANLQSRTAGQIIGVSVRAGLTVENPYLTSGWQANRYQLGLGFAEPGYGRKADGTYGVIKNWGWQLSPPSAEGFVRVVGKPTFKVFGGDVIAGRPLAAQANCSGSATANSIAGWSRSNGGSYDAAFGQLGAFAPGTITGFATAKYTSGNASPPSGLTFANTSTGGERFGGGFTQPFCTNDYNFNKPTLTPLTDLNNLNGSTAPGNYNYSSTGGTLNNNLVLGKGQRISVYATGNVTIGKNGSAYSISYGDRTTWASPDDIAGFRLIVIGGDIYIDRGVTDLSGTFIAQPDSAGTGGNIYTCTQNSTKWLDRDLFSNCSTPLTVNGAFIAKKVHLQRSGGTALRGETAERFNFLPELWVAPWPASQNSTSQLKYDALLSLPPIL